MSKERERPTPQEAAAAWDDLAEEWIPFVREGVSAWRPEVILPSVFRMAGNPTGKRVIDLGCGEGQVTRVFAVRGAECVGVDMAPKLIASAREEAARQGLEIEYVIGDMTDPSAFEAGSFDLAVSVMSILDAPHGLELFAAAAQLLRTGGELVFINFHPVLAHGEWHRDDQGLRTICTIDDYRCPKVVRERISPRLQGEVYQFHYALSETLNALADAGLTLLACEEPTPSAAAMAREPKLRSFLKTAPLWTVRARKV